MTSSWCTSLTTRSTPFWLKSVLRVDCALLSFVDSCGVRLSAYAAILKNKTARVTVVFIASSKLIFDSGLNVPRSQIHFERERAAVAQSPVETPLAPHSPVSIQVRQLPMERRLGAVAIHLCCGHLSCLSSSQNLS